MTVLEFPTPEIPTPDPRTFDETSRPFAEAVAGQYAIKRMIGRGGMGIVYLARDRRLDRLVAIKTLPPQLAADPTVRERFVRETRTAGGMSHPNIVPIHGADEIGGHVFFVMGYVDGESLAAHVRAHGRLPARTVAAYLRDVASALAHAHGRGIVHRDIKAENILIERGTGRALVTDFGIARLAEAAPLTATGQLLGTVYYVSPEQVAGQGVDARSDLYSLGVVGHLALTGRFPFEGELASAVLVAHVTKAAPPVASRAPGVPAALAAVVDRCLEKFPAERWGSADELLTALDAAIAAMDHAMDHAMDGTTDGAPAPLVSDTEAHAVWRRAAELQAVTGIEPRPAPVPRPRDAARDRTRASGLTVDRVRAAAGEAGIDGRYVEHALVEHGLAPAPAAPGAPSAARGRRWPRWSWGAVWAGAPLDIVVEAVVDGELPPRELDRILNLLRDGTASLGTTTPAAGALRWRGAWPGHRLDVRVAPADGGGRTTIRLVQSVRRAALAATVGSLAALGGVAAPVTWRLLDLVLRLPAPAWGVRLPGYEIREIAATVGALTALASIPVARALVRRIRRYHAARLGTLAELLRLTVRDAAARGD